MKDSLQAGLRFERRITVDRERTIGFMGDDGRVYATPKLVHDIEHCCRDLLLEHLDDGEDSVGTVISVEHTAPTLVGMTATIVVTIAEVRGRAVQFEIEAADDLEPIAKGRHGRFVVDTAKTVERLKAKRAKLDGSSARTEAAPS